LLKWILFTLIYLNAFALEISIDSAKDDYVKYSTINLSNSSPFRCQEIKNDFDITTEIICAFSKKPSQSLKTLQNDFFRVNSKIKKDTYFLIIKPVYKINLFSNIFDLSTDNTVFDVMASSSKSWTIIGYKDKFPLIKKDNDKQKIAIDFPFFLDKDKLPYVGSLDLQGNPVHIKKVEDVKAYLQIKKLYKNKNYDACLDTISDVLKTYPNTLFREELVYYKIKTYNELNDWDNVINEAKIFLREYSSSDNIAEVLSLIAKGYSKVSLSSDADYFFDRLFSEHKNSVFAEWGYIYKGDMFNEAGGKHDANKFYIKALNQTNNLEVAASAAFRLANNLIGVSTKKASKYIMKIVNAKPDYFMQELRSSKIMMGTFADEGYYATAAALANSILQNIDATYDEYEELLKNKALWLSKTKNKKEALVALNEYLNKFPDGDYIDVVQTAKDKLFFDLSDLNASSKLVEYDKLIEDYGSDTIGEKALYEKAKLLLKKGDYAQVLNLKSKLYKLDSEIYTDVDKIIKDAAVQNMQISLKNKDCKEVLNISNEYNITLSDKWDDGVYKCAMKGGDYELSKKITLKNLKTKNLDEREKWLYRYIKVEFSTGNYTDVIDASKDLITLIGNDNKSSYKDVYRILFDSYQRVEKKQQMLTSILAIEKVFGLSYKDIDRYVAMLSVGSEMHDDKIIINYAKKIMQIQTESNSYAQSPFVEFTLYQAYLNNKNYNKALDVIQSLDNKKLNAADRARQKYLLGNVLSKLWKDDEAKKAYKDSITADEKSSWAILAKSALTI